MAVRPLRSLTSSALLALVLLASACSAADSNATNTEGSGRASRKGDALDFVVSDLSGAEFRGEWLRGRDAVLWFWAPWCTVCRGEAPDVVAAAGSAEGVRVIGVAGRGGTAEMAEFVSDTGTGSLTHVIDADGSIWSQFGVFAQPAYAFVDDDGTVEVFVGAMGERALTDKMAALAAS